MNQGPNRLLDEFAKLMTDAAGVADGVRREVETAIKSQAERFMAEMDVVKRDDFEVVRELAANARAHNDVLLKRVDALEARIAELEKRAGGSKSSAAQKK